ncbi:hypothetical protein ACHHYP_02346, partial [Achlya hypogyna]
MLRRLMEGVGPLGKPKNLRRLVVFMLLTFAYSAALFFVFPALCIAWICMYPAWLALSVLQCCKGRSWLQYRARMTRYTNRAVGLLCRFDVRLRNLYESSKPIDVHDKLPVKTTAGQLLCFFVYFYGWKVWALKYVFVLVAYLLELGWHCIYTPATASVDAITNTTTSVEGQYDWGIGPLAAALGIWFGTYVTCLFFANVINFMTKTCSAPLVRDRLLPSHQLIVNAPSVGSALSNVEPFPGINIPLDQKGMFCISVPLQPYVQGGATPSALHVTPSHPQASRLEVQIEAPSLSPIPELRLQLEEDHFRPLRPETTHLDPPPAAVLTLDDNDDSSFSAAKPAADVINVRTQQQDASYDPFEAMDFVALDTPVIRDVPDPTG